MYRPRPTLDMAAFADDLGWAPIFLEYQFTSLNVGDGQLA